MSIVSREQRQDVAEDRRDLRLADARTNSIIVAGSRNDLDTIAAIIARLEDAQELDRKSVV